MHAIYGKNTNSPQGHKEKFFRSWERLQYPADARVWDAAPSRREG